MSQEVKDNFISKINESNNAFVTKLKLQRPKKSPSKKKVIPEDSLDKSDIMTDNMFRKFRSVVVKVADSNGVDEKISIFRDVLSKENNGCGSKRDRLLWCKFLLTAHNKRNYRIEKNRIIEIFSELFGVPEQKIFGDIGRAIQNYFEASEDVAPAKTSTLTLFEVDEFLENLTKNMTYDEQLNHFKTFLPKCTGNDLKEIIRLIINELKMTASPKHVLAGLHPEAFEFYKTCKDLESVIDYCDKYDQKPAPLPKKKRLLANTQTQAKANKTRKKSLDDKIAKKIVENDDLDSFVIVEKNEEVKCSRYFFENVKLLVEMDVIREHSLWVRQFIACGGTVLKPDEFQEATHVLHLRDTISEPNIKAPSSARHVVLLWIVDSISNKELQDFRQYTVRWDPKI